MRIKRKVRSFLLKIPPMICIFLLIIFFFGDSPYLPNIQDVLDRETVDGETDRVVFLNVGEGDCILLQSNGRFALIDTGDLSGSAMSRKLSRMGVKGLDAVILTHWHTDHVGGFDDLCRDMPILHLITPQLPKAGEDGAQAAQTVMAYAEEYNVIPTVAQTAMSVHIGEMEMTVLFDGQNSHKANDQTLILMVQCKGKRFLLMADGEQTLEKQLLDEGIDLNCDVLKVGHHGSATSTGADFLSAATPTYAVISVGAGNSFGHPAGSVLNNLANCQSTVYRTDFDGDITVTVEEELTVKVSM